MSSRMVQAGKRRFSGMTDEKLLDVLRNVWLQRKDRYSEERLDALHSETGYDPKEHEKIEMIRLGG